MSVNKDRRHMNTDLQQFIVNRRAEYKGVSWFYIVHEQPAKLSVTLQVLRLPPRLGNRQLFFHKLSVYYVYTEKKKYIGQSRKSVKGCLCEHCKNASDMWGVSRCALQEM